MVRELRQTVTIGPDGRFEGQALGAAEGTVAEIVVLFNEERENPSASLGAASESDSQADWDKHWAASDRLIAEGMETWDIDRVNAEIAARRGGDREVL